MNPRGEDFVSSSKETQEFLGTALHTFLFHERRNVQAGRLHHGASPYGLRPHKQAIVACHGAAQRAEPDGAAVSAARIE